MVGKSGSTALPPVQPLVFVMLNSKAAREGKKSFTQQGLLSMGIGAALAPFTGGISLAWGGCHLVCGVVYDQLKLFQTKDPIRRD